MKIKFYFMLFTIFTGAMLISTCDDQPETDDSAKEQNQPEINFIPVEAEIVKLKLVEESIPLTGVLKPIRTVDVIAEESGKVKDIFKELGSFVRAQDALTKIDDVIQLSNYKQAESQVISAENNLGIAAANLESDKILFVNGDISQLAYNNSVLAVKNAEANHLSALAALSITKKSFEDTRIKTPISGLISRKYLNVGTMVNPGMFVYRVVDISKLKIEVGVSQEFVNKVHNGSLAKISVDALNKMVLTGKVEYISPQADENTGNFVVELHVDNTDKMEIRAGMTAKIDLILSIDKEEIVIPEYSIVNKNGNNYVYKISNNKAMLAEIELIETVGSKAIVGSGLSEGDTIVVVGMKNLGEDTPVFIETIQ